MKNKKLIIGIAILAIVIVLGVILIINRKLEKNNENEIRKAVDIIQVIDIDKIENSKLEMSQAENVQVASKYTTGENTYKLDARVNFNEISGDMIFIREEYSKVNIFQTIYKMNKYEDTNSQIAEAMDEFELMCTSYVGADISEEIEGTLYGTSENTAPIPVEESIYNQGQLYSKTFSVKRDELDEEKTYEINFYKSGNDLVAEFVYAL